jgi:hypothetical protein
MTTCSRTAWLTLGALSVPLEDDAAGYFCNSLDLGYPEVRATVNYRPDQDGTDDRTHLMGARTVTASIVALAGAGARIDEVAASFAPFMVPSARPVLHYVLDRPGAAERVLTLRAAGYSWPVVGAFERDIMLQWVAPDPVVRDATAQTATAWSGANPGNPGRLYNLVFPRVYPVGGGGPISATISSPGDIVVQPLLRIYGPITGPVVNFSSTDTVSGLTTTWAVQFLAAYRIDAGHYVEVDTAARTVHLDGQTSALSAIDWDAMSHGWPQLPVLPDTTTMSLTSLGGNTTGVTQVVAIWSDGYLS